VTKAKNVLGSKFNILTLLFRTTIFKKLKEEVIPFGFLCNAAVETLTFVGSFEVES